MRITSSNHTTPALHHTGSQRQIDHLHANYYQQNNQPGSMRNKPTRILLTGICLMSGVLVGSAGLTYGVSYLVNHMRNPSSKTHPSGSSEKEILNDYYSSASYQLATLNEPPIKLHIHGTANVTEWVMNGTARMATNILASLRNPEDIMKFDNHNIYVITDNDPDIPNAKDVGHKNTGNAKYTIINQALICATAIDTLYPNLLPAWRAWDTPIHELGHSIEFALNLQEKSDSIYSTTTDYNINASREYFAWQTEQWFDADLSFHGDVLLEKRLALSSEKFDYFSSIFDASDNWRPSC